MNEPIIPQAEEFYLRAFYELITGRNQDGRIPWRDIEDYAERAGLDEDLRQPFREIMRALERTFSSWLEDERERKAQQLRDQRRDDAVRQRTPR